MVDVADLTRANAIFTELQQLMLAVHNFENGGKIGLFTVISPVGAPDSVQQIPATYFDVPPQMIEAIVGMMKARAEELDKELQGLGVTGVDESVRTERRK